ncbi:MAG: hypothetical protein HY825_12895 [Acidobacteria bacterium]|nr:hypothetical protein [Acidobacteriota bacterium]
MIAALLAAAVATATPGPAAVPAPTYLVERVVTVHATVRRLSVFRDGTIVLVHRPAAGEPTVVNVRLEPVELRVVAQVVEESYGELLRRERIPDSLGDGWVELRLAPIDRPPLIVRLPMSGAPSYGAARLEKALDELETRLASGRPARENLALWMPEVGERVELEDGRTVEVTELFDSGDGPLARVKVGEGPVTLFLTLDELRRTAVRRVRP